MAERRSARGVAVVSVLLATACSSGGGDPASTPPPPQTTFTVSGTVHAAAATAVDGDTADATAPQTQNDVPSSAQVLPSSVTVGGWASSAVDADDWYRLSLVAGQVITLRIADWVNAGPNDLDLWLYEANNARPPLDSAGTTATETITVPTSGEYFLRVEAYTGASSYVLTISQGPLGGTSEPPPLSSEAEFVPGEVMVRFRDGVLPPGRSDTLEERGASVGLVPLAGGARREMLLGLGAGPGRGRAFRALGAPEPRRDLALEAIDPVRAAKRDTIALVKALRRRPDVASADPNYIFHPTLVPNDEFYARQWHYPLIGLPAAWDVTTGSSAVIVAVVDTGVFLDHPDLAPRLVPGYDFISDPAKARDGNGVDPDPDDPGDDATLGRSSYHGTHVAGTVAAASNNGAGVAGVSWQTRIMPIRVLGVGGGTSFDIVRGVRWAAGLIDAPTAPIRPEQPAHVINLSLGCGGCFSTTEQTAYTEVRNAGVIVIAAAGNDNTSVSSYPASYADVISVSAVDMLRAKAPYSNFGANVDIAAPGGDTSKDRDHDGRPDGVASTWKDDTAAGAAQVAYRYMQGTSMASPHVAGVVALMKAAWLNAACPTPFTPAEVDAILTGGGMTVDLGTAGRDDLFGYGLVDAAKAVQSAASCGLDLPTTLTVAPARLDFGLGAGPLTLLASKSGTGTLPTASATETADWLTVTGPGSADGLGTYTASVSRASLADGVYSATITFTAGSSTVAVPVTMQVGGVPPGPGNVGHLFVVLTNPSLQTVAQATANAVSGDYAFSLPGLPAGSYLLFAGTNYDGDTTTCDPGEACGAYPDVSAPAVLEVGQDRTGLEFTVGYDVALGAGAGGLPVGGLVLPQAAEAGR